MKACIHITAGGAHPPAWVARTVVARCMLLDGGRQAQTPRRHTVHVCQATRGQTTGSHSHRAVAGHHHHKSWHRNANTSTCMQCAACLAPVPAGRLFFWSWCVFQPAIKTPAASHGSHVVSMHGPWAVRSCQPSASRDIVVGSGTGWGFGHSHIPLGI